MRTSRIHIPHFVIVKSPGLLCMLYSVSELSTLLRIPNSTLRDWLRSGAPHMRDARGHLWINGLEFAAWIKDQRKPKRASRLGHNQAYCLRCNQIVKMVKPQLIKIRGKLANVRGRCPDCGCTINRGHRLTEQFAGNSLQTAHDTEAA